MSNFNPNYIPPVTKDLRFVSYKKKDPRYKETWSISDSYEYYKEEELGSLELSKKDYTRFMKDLFFELSKEIIRERLDIKFPNRLGKIRIRKRKNNKHLEKQRINYGILNKEKRLVYLTNHHTNKYYFFWDWEVNDGYGFFTNKSLYKFIPARGNDKITGKRGLCNWIKYCAENPLIKDYDCLIKR